MMTTLYFIEIVAHISQSRNENHKDNKDSLLTLLNRILFSSTAKQCITVKRFHFRESDRRESSFGTVESIERTND